MSQFNVRQARIEDLDILYRFEQGIITAERPFNETLKPGHINYYDLREMLHLPYVHVVVALDGDKIIGSGYARIETAKDYLQHAQHSYLGFMYVDPAYRGKGINNLIIDALKAWSLSRGIYELRLHVYNDNAPAIRAYKKAGFEKHLLEMRIGLKK
jgi:GNAT superfamily N-acetyltransferase